MTAYDLGNVIFQRDNLKDRLRLAQEEIDRVKAQNIKLQTELIDEVDLEDNLQNYGQAIRPSMPKNEDDLTLAIETTEQAISHLDGLLKKPPQKITLDLSPAVKKPNLPGLNFSKLKSVKETDWFVQCQKLEKVIAELREKLNKVTAQKDKLIEEGTVQLKLIETLKKQCTNFKKMVESE